MNYDYPMYLEAPIGFLDLIITKGVYPELQITPEQAHAGLKVESNTSFR